MQCLNGLAVQQTYPHVDMPEVPPALKSLCLLPLIFSVIGYRGFFVGQVGVKAAKQLMALMADADRTIAPKLLRVRVPALVRGDNMITAPHQNVGYVDSLMKKVPLPVCPSVSLCV